jgi:hypothetical protein
MSISPAVPVFGLLLVAINVLIAAVRPYLPPTVMGIQLYLAGLTTLTIAVLDLINPIGIAPYERVILFVGGCINCSLGYYMALLENQRRLAKR